MRRSKGVVLKVGVEIGVIAVLAGWDDVGWFWDYRSLG